MEKIKNAIKRNLKGFILGLVIAGGVGYVIAETYLDSDEVYYDNTTSGLTSSTVYGATNELYEEALNIKKMGLNTLYSGKNLGTSYTSAQQTAISSGTFDGLGLGDYWVIGGHNWRIWGFDWYMNKGSTKTTAHHVVILPDDNLLDADGSTTHYMNDSNTTSGGYAGSKLRSTYVSQMETTINSCFGTGHILSHKELLSTSVDANGKANNWDWYDSTVEVPSEVMMYGSTIWSNYGGSGYNVGTAYPILPLALVKPEFVINREHYWLRDVVSSSSFAYVSGNGYANSHYASTSVVGVRPYFLLS